MLEINNVWAWVFLVTLILSVLAQLYYYLFVFSKLAFYKSPIKQESIAYPPVSVIIAARNEYRNLQENLPSILEQDYPHFEVIVVNDCSWDDSQKLLEYYQENYPHLKICKLIEQEKYPTGKKFALTIGIKAAQYENLFFTDADCKPNSNQWLKLMQSRFSDNQQAQIVLGYSPHKKYKGFLNLFIRYETVLTATAYFSAAILKRSFMGVGRNLAYTKTLFFKHKGFASHQHLLSGDDDLFVNEAATPNNVTIQLHPDSFMYTEPKRKMGDWMRQKDRHVGTGKFYKSSDKLFLGIYYTSLLLFYGAFITLFFLKVDPIFLAIVYGIRFLVQTVIFYLVLKKLRSTSLIWFIPLLDFVYLLFIWVFGIKGFFTRQRKMW